MAHRARKEPADFNLDRRNVAGQNRNLLFTRKAQYRTLGDDLHRRWESRSRDNLRVVLRQWIIAERLQAAVYGDQQVTARISREFEALRCDELSLGRNPL